jgi:hypothetical protein
MSQWLQVAAIARIDDIRRNQVSVEEAKEMFEKSFGKECSWEHGDFEDAYNHPENYLPMGSEGSLTMDVWVNPVKNSVDSYTVSIFGSLRDMDEVEADKIIEWFKNKISSKSLGYGVRNAVIDVESELHVHKVWVYNPDNVAVQFSHDSKAKS